MSLIPEEFYRPVAFPRMFNRWFPTMDLFPNFGNQVRMYKDKKNHHLHVEVPMPGVKTDDIDIRLEHGMLQIRAESKEEEKNEQREYYSSRSYFNSIPLPPEVNEKLQPQASYKDGILNISLPLSRVKEKREAKRIPVTVGQKRVEEKKEKKPKKNNQ